MNDWCVKTCQDREDYKFTNSQIPRLLRQKVMVYCGINLQTSKALRNTNNFFFGMFIIKCCKLVSVQLGLFSLVSRMTTKPLKCAVFFMQIHGLWESRFRVIKLGCYVIVDIGCKYVTFSFNVRIKI